MPYNVLAFVGSLRSGSLNRTLFNAARELAPENLSITEFENLGGLPFYNADLDGENKPAAVAELNARVRAADALMFVSPEYNYSVPGVLKNAIDWASRGGPHAPLLGQPASVMGGSIGISGTMRMQYQLRQILVIANVPVMVQPEVVLPKFNERVVDGRLTDESTRALVKKHMAAFEVWISRFVSEKK